MLCLVICLREMSVVVGSCGVSSKIQTPGRYDWWSYCQSTNTQQSSGLMSMAVDAHSVFYSRRYVL